MMQNNFIGNGANIDDNINNSSHNLAYDSGVGKSIFINNKL